MAILLPAAQLFTFDRDVAVVHELNKSKHSNYASRGQDRRVRRIDESRVWVNPYINVIEFLQKEDRVNRNRHPNDLTKVAWTKTNIIATKHGASASLLMAAEDNGLCTQTITGDDTKKVFLVHVKRISGTGKVEITADGVTWTNVTRKINNELFTQVNTKIKMLEHSIIGFRLGTYRDEIAVCRAQSVEL